MITRLEFAELELSIHVASGLSPVRKATPRTSFGQLGALQHFRAALLTHRVSGPLQWGALIFNWVFQALYVQAIDFQRALWVLMHQRQAKPLPLPRGLLQEIKVELKRAMQFGRNNRNGLSLMIGGLPRCSPTLANFKNVAQFMILSFRTRTVHKLKKITCCLIGLFWGMKWKRERLRVAQR